jgi:hypothetical protein
MQSVTIGADIELFICDKQDNLLSAIDIIKATKDKPKQFKNGAIFHDNVAAEFNMLAHTNRTKFKRNIVSMMRRIQHAIAPNKLTTISSAKFPDNLLDNDEAREFGCNPDYDAWRKVRNEVPSGAAYSNFRSVGGHVHVGHPNLQSVDGITNVIRVMDILLGIPSIILDKTDGTEERRQLYGQAGSFRKTSYGVEYRTLSSFWVASGPLMDFVWDMAIIAAEIQLSHKSLSLIGRLGADNIPNIINNHDYDEAMNIIPIIDDVIPEFSNRINALLQAPIEKLHTVEV